MRALSSPIWDLWAAGGPFIGEDGAAHGRVTVEPGWNLYTESTNAITAGDLNTGNKFGPIRWFQNSANDQVEVEVPHVASIEIQRSLDTDAATCTIVLTNQWHHDNLSPEAAAQLGRPGYFSWNYGATDEAQDRWDQAPNSWTDVLVPNALLRTRQGYGGRDKSIGDALADGNIYLTGMWLIDSVEPSSNGQLRLVCRDMAALLVDQIIFPPLIPVDSPPNYSVYPLRYRRFVHTPIFDPGPPPEAGIATTTGDYLDFADIVRDLLLWSGFWLQGAYDTYPGRAQPACPVVYGNIELTGTYGNDPISPEVFDKRPVIDAIRTIKEIVGYDFWVDDEGAARFEAPNIWAIGNFDETGAHTDFMPVIDEVLQMTAYSVAFQKKALVSEIVISSERPVGGLFNSTVTTRYRPPFASLLRGIEKPFGWVNKFFTDADEQRIMAELVALHIYFQLRQGRVTAAANPLLAINDQVRIFERSTSETNVHYIRAMNTQMDLKTGVYSMELTTHWMGSDDSWAITTSGGSPQFEISDVLGTYLANSPARTIVNSPFGTP